MFSIMIGFNKIRVEATDITFNKFQDIMGPPKHNTSSRACPVYQYEYDQGRNNEYD